MSIASEISRIKQNISDAYSEAYIKGASSPLVENSENLASTIATITGGGSNKEYEEGTFTLSESTPNPTITFANTHTVAPSVFAIVETSEQPLDANGIYYYLFLDFEHITDYHIKYQGSGYQSNVYSLIYAYIQKTATTGTALSKTFSNSYTNTRDDNTSYPRYYVKETGVNPRANFNGNYPDVVFVANHTYKWYAIWK